MHQATGSPLRRIMMESTEVPFSRVGVAKEKRYLPFGFGFVFPSCWDGKRTRVHLSNTACPHCQRSASRGVFTSISLCVWRRDGSESGFTLPHVPTRVLLLQDAESAITHVPVVETRRVRGPGSPIDVSVRFAARSEELEDEHLARARRRLRQFFLFYYQGSVGVDEALNECLPWSEARRLVDS